MRGGPDAQEDELDDEPEDDFDESGEFDPDDDDLQDPGDDDCDPFMGGSDLFEQLPSDDEEEEP